MDFILCPICKESIDPSLSTPPICKKGHKFSLVDGILDLLPGIKDDNLLNEEEHWDEVADRGGLKIVPDQYFGARIVKDYRKRFEDSIDSAWEGKFPSDVSIADIGCGSGSAIRYLDKIKFQKVDYIGIDISIKFMRVNMKKNTNFPNNWNVRFIRTTANTGIFGDGSLDMVFSASALHHLNLSSVIEWVSKALKPNGLLILHEPSSGNFFAKFGRRYVRGFHTKGEKPMEPDKIKQVANDHDLELVYEKGLHYLTGSLQYLLGILKLPVPLVFCIYQISRFIDSLVLSPSLNYSFIQVYKKK